MPCGVCSAVFTDRTLAVEYDQCCLFFVIILPYHINGGTHHSPLVAMASWIAWHSARQTVSTLCFLVLIVALLVDCNAQSLERGIRAPKNKFIRFGRSGQKFIRFGRNSAIANDDIVPRAVAYEDNLFEQSPFFKQLTYNKRAGQKFIRFG